MELTQLPKISETDQSLRIATILGICSVPVTVAVSLFSSGNVISFTPVLFAGVIVGYHYNRTPISIGRAGLRTGLLGGLPTIWHVFEILEDGWSASFEYGVLTVLFVPVAIVFGLSVAVLASVVGAAIGDRVARGIDQL
ncbi:DUF5518 domain-containing protein [Halomicroarcula sp. S1AR25-4]|uniref:DUF5518 domain-containing protein n=1 Tax=Haloarcula sp. S1AR25-4 TaxID=2950538 RepID=UPI0028751E85|nr:DUF5518 domain-containing protein [Halomicroarcula sp. S1AR25-4]MDS0277311.1 DUF5518 domain-containing protein [Halomicroarcula sp. S1AR25-4]